MKHLGRQRRERMTVTQNNLPSISSEFAQEIIRYRRAMRQALYQLQVERPDVAARTLREALAERWWQ